MTSCHSSTGSWLVIRIEPRVAVLDDFHEVAALIGVETVGSPVVEDEEIGLHEGPEQAGVSAVAAGQFQFGEHPGDAFVEDGEVVAAGLLAERAGEPCICRRRTGR